VPSDYGPTPDPSVKKAKLKTPFDDLASMVKVKKNKKKEDLSEKKRKQADADAKAAEDAKKREEEKTTSKEPTLLPTYKINLKKQSDNSNAKMKGASLSLLGGYDSASGSSNDSDD